MVGDSILIKNYAMKIYSVVPYYDYIYQVAYAYPEYPLVVTPFAINYNPAILSKILKHKRLPMIHQQSRGPDYLGWT